METIDTLDNVSSPRLSAKRMKLESEKTRCELGKTLQSLLKGYSVSSSTQFNQIYELLSSNDPETRWLAIQCISLILELNDVQKEKLRNQYDILNEVDVKFGLNFHLEFERELLLNSDMTVNLPDLPKSIFKSDPETSKSTEQEEIGQKSMSVSLLKIEKADSSDEPERNYILLNSFRKIMREMVYDICMGAHHLIPICLVGATGTGKSTIINLTASLFKRTKYPDIITVQMSDQIDSRLLLGSYHSTDLPGQFVWKPGCLTKAVLNGHWIVLEDLDSASSDVTTLFDSLIDTGSLSVPGYGEIRKSKFHKDFRLFSTCRTFSNGSNDRKALERIGRHWKKYKLDSFTPTDLKIFLMTLFPHLKNITEKLSTIFSVMEEAKMIKGSKSRLLSLRDFFKLCRRIPLQLDFTKSSSALKIFQEAYDLFIASLYDPVSRKEMAEILGAHLNIRKENIEYFCGSQKPMVSIDMNNRTLTAGRFTLPMFKHGSTSHFHSDGKTPAVFSLTKRACSLLEMICGAVGQDEPVLLLGETGVGKTSCIQFLAQTLCQKLVVVNLNRQSDSSDLLGGYKPVELKYIFAPLREEFETLFIQTFNRETNRKFLDHIMTCFANRQWTTLVKLMTHVQKTCVVERAQKFKGKKDIYQRWATLGNQLSRIETQLSMGQESPFAFSFIEGTLIDAIRKGYWILLDEINLASPEMLQCLSGVLESTAQIHLWEKGNEDAPITRHKNFHLFAAMNPSTDVGKKDLPLGLRNRFTEFFVDELTDADELGVLVLDYLREMSLSMDQVKNIVKFYLTVKSQAKNELVDGTGKKPHFSLRTLCRALKIASQNLYGSVSRSLYESFCISFLTQLDYSSHPLVQQLIAKHIFVNQNLKAILGHAIPKPPSGNYIFIEGYWIPKGDGKEIQPEQYILTPSIRRNLKDIARIVSAGKLPILIQGETSVGKTSLIQYLAQVSGNKCYRINNHQHTDLQEYIGSYQSDDHGKLVFTEGVLVQAMRRGEWIILDELNLAPSEVLEALNRLLDDNRQLFITETGVTVTAHPRFTLFATQNPPGLYGGRKLLSRAFRNRFVELHFDEIPSPELETILHQRCAIPPSYCKKIIGVMKELQMRRKASAALQGKHGFATLRDLFRWAERYRLSSAGQDGQFYDWDQHLADDGYLVLAGKVRQESEEVIIREVIKKVFKRSVDPQKLFTLSDSTSSVTRDMLKSLEEEIKDSPGFRHIVWTFQMRRLAVLIGNAMKFKEPVLLVGETGCGKTSVVQLLAVLLQRKLFSINCHMHSEGSDFLGGLRPVRNREEEDDEERKLFEWVNGPLVEAMESGGVFLADEISLADDSVLERVNSVLEPERTLLISEKGDETPKLIIAHEGFQFVGTMNPGGDYGKKELSPALRNRLTEIWCPGSTDESDLIEIIEHNLSQELGLKNKGISKIMLGFTRWLQTHELTGRCTVSIRDLLAWVNFINIVVQDRRALSIPSAVQHGACLTFLDGLGSGNTSVENADIWKRAKTEAFKILNELTKTHWTTTSQQGENNENNINFIVHDDMDSELPVKNTIKEFGIGVFTITKKQIKSVSDDDDDENDDENRIKTERDVGFSLQAPTTRRNGLRILRALQLRKPILLEGSPGVGKTAIVSALAKLTNNTVVRINLSEQTDISDLFGADLPVEGETGGHFAWRDGPLLTALKDKSWVLLDELNLASQSVLEGLNACLDHRGEIYVPELNRTFKINNSESDDNENSSNCGSRIFACQNPVRQGGARKGLPRSFLNRFTQVFMDPLGLEDMNAVVQSSYPELPFKVIETMTEFSELLSKSVGRGDFGVRGSPWDFNLRDLIRWASLVWEDGQENEDAGRIFEPSLFVDLIYGLRMRSKEDRVKVLQLFNNVKNAKNNKENNDNADDDTINISDTLENSLVHCGQSEVLIMEDRVICGMGFLPRNRDDILNLDGNIKFQKLEPLPHQLPALEGLIKCLQMGWMPILVGPSSGGKTSLVKLIAQICGRDLQIMTPSPEMDTIELLGGFEQADVYRRLDQLTVDLSDLMTDVARHLLLRSSEARNSHGHSHAGYSSQEDREESNIREFLKDWWSMKKIEHLTPQDGSGQDEELERIQRRLEDLEEAFSKCKSAIESIRRAASSSLTSSSSSSPGSRPSLSLASGCNRMEERSKRVEQGFQEIYSHLKGGIQTGGFHWIHSLLIKAVIKGDWLLIDGANRCTAAVLDRLNSLMEPGGSLWLSERGSTEDGEILEITPHPNFRLILAMNPIYGEISRAMRNRGVEIYVPGPTELNRGILSNGAINGVGQNDNEDRAIAARNERDAGRETMELSMDNFLSSRWYRAWTRLRILENAIGTDSMRGTNNRLTAPSSLDGWTLENCLMTSLFSRLSSSTNSCLDAESLSWAISTKFPSLSLLSTKLVEIITAATTTSLSKMEQEQEEEKEEENDDDINEDETSLYSYFGDVQWEPYFIAKYGHAEELLVDSRLMTHLFTIVKMSLNLHKILLLEKGNEKITQELRFASGTVGFIAQNILHGGMTMVVGKEFEESSELLTTFLTAFKNLQVIQNTLLAKSRAETEDEEWVIVERAGEEDKSSLCHSLSLTDIAQLWLKGLRMFIWIRRLKELLIKDLSPKRNNEVLFANLILVLEWIEEDVMPALRSIRVRPDEYYKARNQLTKLLKDLNAYYIDNIDDDEESSTVDGGKNKSVIELRKAEEVLREEFFLTDSIITGETDESRNSVANILRFVLDFWSSKSRVMTRDGWPKFLESANGQLLFMDLNRLCTVIVEGNYTFQPDDLAILNKLKEEFGTSKDTSVVTSTTDSLTKSNNETSIENLIFNLNAALEFLRETGRRPGASSLFKSPILNALNVKESSALTKYLEREENSRFQNIFLMDVQSRNLENSNLLPYFVSRMLIDSNNCELRSYSLGSREEVQNCFKKLSTVIYNECWSTDGQSGTTKKGTIKENLRKALNKFQCEIKGISKTLMMIGAGDLLSGILSRVNELEKRQQDEEHVSELEMMMKMGEIMVETGGIVLSILTSLPRVDPAVKKRISAHYLKEDCDLYRVWMKSHQLHRTNLTRAFTINSGDAEERKQEMMAEDNDLSTYLSHPFYTTIREVSTETEEKLTQVSERIPDRPDPPGYNEILAELKAFSETLANRRKLKSLLHDIKTVFSSSGEEKENKERLFNKLNQVIISCQNWIAGHAHFVDKLSKQIWYWDIVAPSLWVSCWVITGLEYCMDGLTWKYKRPNEPISNALHELVTFPMKKKKEGDSIETLLDLLHTELRVPEKVTKRLFLSSLENLVNEIETAGLLTMDSIREFYSLVNSLTEAWRRAEEEERQRKEEQDSLYIYKGKERTLALTEDEQDALDARRHFPSYDQDFQDLMRTDEDAMDIQLDYEPPVSWADDLNSLDERDISTFMNLLKRVNNFVASYWILNGDKGNSNELDFIQSFINRFQVGCLGYENFDNYLNRDDEKYFVLGSSFALSVLYDNDGNNKRYENHRQVYDIYRDSNVKEVEALVPVLKGMRKRICELLQEWPDHPSLNKIILVLNRLESFPIDIPIMKFLTGLELLMVSAQEWESNAHAGVSIAIQLGEATGLISRWRKMELSSWKHLLEVTLQKEQSSSHKWWFHIMTSTLEILNVEQGKENSKTPSDLLKALQQFIESSSIGQYEIRLNILQQVHYYIIALEKFRILENDDDDNSFSSSSLFMQIHTIFWCTIKFYQEFLPSVQAHLTKLRDPIEKQMKDFVKILRWDDKSHISVQASVHKSQKKLVKLMKDFKKVLVIPVRTLLVSDNNSLPQRLKTINMGLNHFKRFIIPKNTKVKQQQQQQNDEEEILVSNEVLENQLTFVNELIMTTKSPSDELPTRNLVKIFRKMMDLSQGLVKIGLEEHKENFQDMEDLMDSATQTLTDLQNVEITVKGEERKKFLHHVHSRRRLALTELFKSLTSLNLSHRRGLLQLKNQNPGNAIESSSTSSSAFQDYLIEPHDLSAGWKQLQQQDLENSKTEKEIPWKPSDDFLVKLWSSGVESVFQKSLIRLLSMGKAFESPNKQLSVGIIERCKGFSVDLMRNLRSQKVVISEFSKGLWTVRNLLNIHTHSIGETGSSLSSLSVSLTEKIYEKFCTVQCEIEQWKLLLKSNVSKSTVSLVALKHGDSSAIAGELLISCESLMSILEREKKILKPYVNGRIGAGKEILLKTARDIINVCRKYCNDSHTVNVNGCLLVDSWRESIENLITFLEFEIIGQEIEMELEIETNSLDKNRLVKVLRSSLLKNLMLTFQKLEGLQKETEEKDKKDKENKSSSKSIFENAGELISCFNIEQITKGLQELIGEFGNTNQFSQVLQSFRPIIGQYLILGQFYLSELVWWHRENCQLLTILCSLFSTLGQKGFCLPPDYEEEAMKEGSELDAKGGLGLGEGETTPDAKDVSDRIESEDQLEDTLKPGESGPEPAEKDVDENDKGIEMNDDFEGKLQDDEKQKEKKDGDKSDDENDDDDDENQEETEPDKQMGDVNDPDAEKLDDQLWGGSSDEEDEAEPEELDETGGSKQKQQGEPELKAKDPRLEQQEEDEDEDGGDKNNEKEKEKPMPEENEDEEPNDDQIDPYHGENGPEQEPEPLDLPDELNLDNAEMNDKNDDEDQGEMEDNPFDLDKEKLQDAENKDNEEEEDENKDGEEEQPENEIKEMEKEGDEEEGDENKEGGDVNVENQMEVEEPIIEEKENPGGTEIEPDPEKPDGEGDDPTNEKDKEEEQKLDEDKLKENDDGEKTGEDQVEPSEELKNRRDENVVGNQSKDEDEELQVATEEQKEPDPNDDTGSGQAESRSGVGVEGKMAKQKEQEKNPSSKEQEEKSAKEPSDMERKRTLVDQSNESASAKRLKTLENPNHEDETREADKDDDDDNSKNPDTAEMYQHITEGEKHDAITIDNATTEEAEKAQPPPETKDKDDSSEENPSLEDSDETAQTTEEDEEPEIVEAQKRGQPNTEKQDEKKTKKNNKTHDSNEDEHEEEEPLRMEVEGENVQTTSVSRADKSEIHTRFEVLEEERESKLKKTRKSREEEKENNDTEDNDDEVVIMDFDNMGESCRALAKWHELETTTLPLAQELCEQLRLILEPTLAARLRGDYKTGKRLNMRKVIPYVASGFRKDKIWLRRTQPSKREYQILLALDDSSSMSDNQSKQMAFSAVAVVAKSIGLLEAGQLSVVSFGERIEMMHPFENPFTDSSGAHLLEKFTFAQRQTRIGQLMQYVTKSFVDVKERGFASSSSNINPEIAQLALIISDGRNVSSEGEETVRRAIRKAREENIFIVFIIVDNPGNKDSILDIRYAKFDERTKVFQFDSYMDHFPFPFYLILRDLSSLPSVLSDALRQWFELVTSSQ